MVAHAEMMTLICRSDMKVLVMIRDNKGEFQGWKCVGTCPSELYGAEAIQYAKTVFNVPAPVLEY